LNFLRTVEIYTASERLPPGRGGHGDSLPFAARRTAPDAVLPPRHRTGTTMSCLSVFRRLGGEETETIPRSEAEDTGGGSRM
jgi:hypothetical protein